MVVVGLVVGIGGAVGCRILMEPVSEVGEGFGGLVGDGLLVGPLGIELNGGVMLDLEA